MPPEIVQVFFLFNFFNFFFFLFVVVSSFFEFISGSQNSAVVYCTGYHTWKSCKFQHTRSSTSLGGVVFIYIFFCFFFLGMYDG
jgi:hypothetical protein